GPRASSALGIVPARVTGGRYTAQRRSPIAPSPYHRPEASLSHYWFTPSRETEIGQIRIQETTTTVVFSKRRKTSSI
ncbi:MAG: hypothetical protein VX704_02920, partial [Verrucomicrobiota bacterium]|nr:hypothetical protein [Verrucomicrobiota bacterium]